LWKRSDYSEEIQTVVERYGLLQRCCREALEKKNEEIKVKARRQKDHWSPT